jgi:hypothetical protein
MARVVASEVGVHIGRFYNRSRMLKYRKHLLAAAVLLVPSQGTSAESKDRSYYCTSDAVGGIWYNDRTKKWQAADFKPDGNFVLKMEFFRAYTNKDALSETDILEYSVSVTAAGSNYPAPCSYDFFYAHTDKHAVPLMNNRLRCNASLVDYVFDFSSNRFLGAYLQGYTDGKNDNENTPHHHQPSCDHRPVSGREQVCRQSAANAGRVP